MLEILIAIILGLLAGTITGLFPGIHINLIAATLIVSIDKALSLPFVSPISLAVFIASMAITHTFLDFIPAIFLGAPEEDSFLSILPGHQLLKQGLGYEAIVLTLYGSLAALIISLIFIPIFIFALPKIYTLSRSIIPFILIFASLYLILRENSSIKALIIFLLAGILGYLTFNLPIKEPLLPLLTGLFGLSALIISIKNKTQIPEQRILPLKDIKLSKRQILSSSVAASLTAPLASFLPGFGSGQAALISSEIKDQKDNNPREFLFLVGIINTVVMALSFITIFSIEKTRTGAAASILEILKTISSYDLTVIILTIFISGILAFFLGIKISKIAARNISKINYTYLSIFLIAILLTLNMIITNPTGILVLITASALGTFTILSGARRINLMGALILPTILFYLFL